MEVVNLRKGETINLRKQAPTVKRFKIGLSWKTAKYTGQEDFDLDVSAPQLDSNGHVLKPNAQQHICGYLSYKTPDGSLTYSGDNQKGKAGTDVTKYEETLVFEPDFVEDRCVKIPIVITIDEWADRGQTFGMVDNAFCEILNADNDEVLYHYDLSESYSMQTAVTVFEFSRSSTNKKDWVFKPIDEGYDSGLDGYMTDWGLTGVRE